MDPIYLDNNATTRPDPAVVEAMLAFLQDDYANPSSVHRLGQRARAAVDEAREQIATLVGVRDREITFTGTGTEATNTALRGLVAARRKSTIVTSVVEHDATAAVAKAVAGDDAVEIGVDGEGRLDLEAFREAVGSEGVACASLIWANNETGVLTDVAAAAEICREHKVPLHVDATQAVGKIDVDLGKIGCDLATFAPHKFHGPKGVGVLWVRRGLRIPPLLVGGPQERDRRGGTENVPGIVGSGVAAELAGERLGEMERVRELRDELERRLLASLSDVRINGGEADRLPNTSNVAFLGLHAEAILLMLSEQGICASAGAACSSGSLDPSRVLLAMGVPEPWAFGSIRLSLSRLTTAGEIDRVLEVLPPIVERLRRVLPTAA